MPSQGRLRRGRTRSKTRALRAARSKPMISEAEGGIGEETPAVESPQRGKSPKKQAIMAATPQPSRKEFLGGLTRQTQKWSQNRFRMVLLTLFILMVLCYYMSPGFVNSVSPNEYLWSNEGPRGESVEEPSTWVSALHFFFPTRPLQMFRILGFSGVSMMILACLPIFCFSLCRRSKWANPLRRKANRMLKGLKKQKNKLKKDAQLLETAAEDEEELSDKKKQETKALLPR
ncbi:fragile X mental retardation 1 neighbor protein isoform X2 [Rousettus aegyptiacus]|uniref:FMR1 neighbor n=1 Tax=Rousettus aegyptiacus TaxID=9407 RepID=A0A7J8EJF7_ROUAE|nr:fragile X mental retardation 1 neighbor protein isoform X2 [Rousettus aegyptiacus]KAF6435415.1 FMR1 neighbor [Rousettus aegyptiacus]